MEQDLKWGCAIKDGHIRYTVHEFKDVAAIFDMRAAAAVKAQLSAKTAKESAAQGRAASAWQQAAAIIRDTEIVPK